MIESLTADPNQKAVGYYDAGSVICYDNVNMNGVRSIDFLIAKGASDAGRFAILVGGNSLSTGTNLGEKITNTTGGWETYQVVNVGLSQQVSGNQTLCFYGVSGGGIFNLDKFTLSDVAGQNDGVSKDPDELPNNPGNGGIAKITTQGSKVLFGGQPGSIAGMSLFWSNDGWGGEKYYNADVVKELKNNWNAKLVRAAMGINKNDPEGGDMGSYIQNRESNVRKVKTVVNAAIENNMYVIIDWHAHEAQDFRNEAIEFFREMSALYGNYDNVIYEIYNEPLQVSWSSVIKPYAEAVIRAIRENDPDNLIIVGTPSWSQEVDQAAADPITISSNIAYTLHFYAGTHHQWLRDKAAAALASGIPLFVTEWGAVDADGNGAVNQSETQAWITFMKNNNISHANWALNDKAEGASALVEGASANGGWSDSQLTESGRLVKNLIKNW
jgi:hypothetical protein